MSRKLYSVLACRPVALSASRTKGSNSMSCSGREIATLSAGLVRIRHGLNKVHLAKTKKDILNTYNKSSNSGFCLLKFRSTSSTDHLSNGPQECKELSYIDTKDNETLAVMCQEMTVIEDFISEEEEKNILKEVEPYLNRQKYQSSHWDDAIHEYRETERRKWTEKNTAIIQRVRDVAFPPGVPQISFVHVLDLKKEGQIKPHVDAVKFCGNTIAGISLLSSSVMRLVHTEEKTKAADIWLKRRSLYIMKNEARYKYTHEILPEAESYFRGTLVPRDRRISVICRNEPDT